MDGQVIAIGDHGVGASGRGPLVFALAGAVLLNALILMLMERRDGSSVLPALPEPIAVTWVSAAAPEVKPPAEVIPQADPAPRPAPQLLQDQGPRPTESVARPATPAARASAPPVGAVPPDQPTRQQILAAKKGLWSLLCADLDLAGLESTSGCRDDPGLQAPGSLSAALQRLENQGLVDPTAQMRTVLGPAFKGMDLSEIRAAMGADPLAGAPGLDALPAGAQPGSHLSSVDDVADRLPATQPDPSFGN